ncbi:MAG: Fe-S cluster assembly protein SufD [Bacteroidales bacterium]|nr:Fe-S cluster assembly protein SufD [Bacteroidales bacterium]
MNATNITPKDEFINLYIDNLDLITENSAKILNMARQSALESFKILGFPNAKNEKYKYTRVEKLFHTDYEKYFTPKNITFNIDDIFRCDIPSLDTHLALTLNGFYLSNPDMLVEIEQGVIIGSLAEAAKKYPNVVSKYYNTLADNDEDGLVALNTAFSQDGVFIYIPKGVMLEKPIQIINLMMSDENQLVHYRNLIIADENAQADIVICDHTLSPSEYLSNIVTEVFTNRGANLDIVSMQNQHNDTTEFTHVFGKQERDSVLSTNTVSLHGGIIRNNIHILLNDENCENHTYGLALADRNQHIDMYSFIDHAKPNCNSNELYKALLDDQATGAFNGRILVRQDAQKTQAFQSNNNLLLTADAKMYTKPQLEIYADDVKCTHGATVGQLDMEAKFYMQSRGIGEREAKLLLMFGFAHDVIGHIKAAPLRERIDELVNKRLRGDLSRCNNCPMNCC